MGNLIDRDALKEAINKIIDEEIKIDEKWTKGLKYSLKIIDNAPSIADRTEGVLSLQNTIAKLVEGIAENGRQQGEWKLHGMIYYCSECGHECGESGDNFCGNCGASMKGGAV